MRKFRKEESGQVLIITVLSLVAMIVICLAVIGLGRTYTTYHTMQTAADVAAMSADNLLPLPEVYEEQLTTVLQQLLQNNNIDLNKVNATFKFYKYNSKIYACKVILQETLKHRGGNMMKKGSSNISVESLSRKSGEIEGSMIEYTFPD